MPVKPAHRTAGLLLAVAASALFASFSGSALTAEDTGAIITPAADVVHTPDAISPAK